MSEPAFWAGFDRGSVDGFRDYFRQLTEFEPKRAGQYGIQHYTWLCINAKEAENVSLSREVIAMIPEFLDKPDVLGIGEIGLNKNTRNEVDRSSWSTSTWPMKYDQQILIHTPHLEDKYQGTRMILDMLCDDSPHRPQPRAGRSRRGTHDSRTCSDEGFWAGMTLYPVTKCTPQRAADMIEMYGPERLMVNSAGDWGPSKPTAVPDFILEMRRRRIQRA